MNHFGEDLRRERETRGVALGTIVDETKISSRHLAALEQEEFDQLPGGVFNKGIVRSYARVVGLNEDDWVGRYMAAYQESGQVKDDDASWIEFAENVSRTREHEEGTRPELRLRWAGVSVLLMLVFCFGWFVWHFVNGRVSAAHNTQPIAATVAQTSTAGHSVGASSR